MIIIRNNIIPFPRFKAINLCGILFVRKNTTLTETDINHERIHTRQMLELLVVGFYLLYVLEYCWRYLNAPSGKIAYRRISFEREAYFYQSDMTYLKHRKHFAQWQ